MCQSRARQQPGEPVIESPSAMILTGGEEGGVLGGVVGVEVGGVVGVVVGGVVGLVVGGVVGLVVGGEVVTAPVQVAPLRVKALGAGLLPVQAPLKPTEAVPLVATALFQAALRTVTVDPDWVT